MSATGRQALVIGGGVGGLLAARALSESFTQVTVLDRDEIGDSSEPRRGAPQGRHAHGLLASGSRALEQLFPGLGNEIVAAGGIPGDISDNCLWHNFGGYLRCAPSDLQGVLISRPKLESLIRRRVRALPNVTLRGGRDVLGLEVAHGRVTGVSHRASGSHEPPDAAHADLTVDATGRGGRAAAWLQEIGYEKPDEERIETEVAYTTRLFRRRPGDLSGRNAALVAASPPNWRGAALLGMEGDLWMLSLGGRLGDRAPEDIDGFLAFARTLPTPVIFDIASLSEPVGGAAVYGFKASVRRRYERLARFPEGYLVFADGLANFNPTYGQGMSVAAAEALALRNCIAQGFENLPRRFFAAAAKIVDVPWRLAAGGDLADPRVKGPRTAAGKVVGWCVKQVYVAGHADARVAHTFLRVANLVAPPATLFDPANLWRVAQAHLGAAVAQRRRSGGETARGKTYEL